MIPRYQRILFLVLLVASVLMAVVIVRHSSTDYNLRENASETPIEAQYNTPAEPVTLVLANDNEGSLTETSRQIALPAQPAIRARALLEHLLAEYTNPRSAHHLGGGVAVEDVYLVPLPLGGGSHAGDDDKPGELKPATEADPLLSASGELAIVNVRSAWCDAHPSGIAVETLTIASILNTLRANIPEISYVRFLADGQTRSTLAGNVEFDRTYGTTDVANMIAAAKP